MQRIRENESNNSSGRHRNSDTTGYWCQGREPVMLTEGESREIFRSEIMSECSRSIGVTLGMSKALRTLESASATRSADRWTFDANATQSEVYQSGAVTGELLDELVSICDRGNS